MRTVPERSRIPVSFCESPSAELGDDDGGGRGSGFLGGSGDGNEPRRIEEPTG